MKMIALAVFVLIWLVIASIPRGPDKKDEGSWYADRVAPKPLSASVPATAPQGVKQAIPKPGAFGSPWVCKRFGEPPRSLVLERKAHGYELVYKTPDGSEAIAWSQSSVKPCERVLARVTRKLQAAGYSCSAQAGSG